MSWSQTELKGSSFTNTSAKYNLVNLAQKPIEMYLFIDPLCSECWSLEPYLKKLALEYGRYFTIRTIISGELSSIYKNNSTRISKTHKKRAPVLFPWVALAIKAAELQGKSAGRTFLRNLQVNFFLKNQDVSNKSILIECAKESKLDLHEFKNDIFSNIAKKAFQCDLSIKKEMEVEGTPTIVLFNQVTEDHGIKINGIHPYNTYKDILKSMLSAESKPVEVPPLEDFLAYYKVVANREIAEIYDWSADETIIQMKKLQLKQKVKRASLANRIFWKYLV